MDVLQDVPAPGVPYSTLSMCGHLLLASEMKTQRVQGGEKNEGPAVLLEEGRPLPCRH